MRTITRQQAIDLLRPRLAERADDKHCVCEVAARTGILCHGFAQWSYADLKRRFWWLTLRHPDMPRAGFEALANAWVIERQRRFGTELCCDAQASERDLCKGWDEFDDPSLARFVGELCGEQVNVVRSGPAEASWPAKPSGRVADSVAPTAEYLAARAAGPWQAARRAAL